MIDSTNPRIMADNIKELNSTIIADNTFSVSESDTGKVWMDGKKIYRTIASLTLPESITDGTYEAVSAPRIDTVDTVISINGIVGGSNARSLPYVNNDGYFIKAYFNFSAHKLTLVSNGASFASNSATLIMEYTKVSSDAKNGGDDENERSIEMLEEPGEISEESEEVTVKKTTRKK